jgi:predicted RNA binding protein YcfA (HicA-like mRNA interferase family)
MEAADLKVREVLRVLADQGFVLDRQSGSHRQFEALIDGRRRIVTVAGRDSDDIHPKTLASIIRQSGLPRRAFKG